MTDHELIERLARVEATVEARFDALIFRLDEADQQRHALNVAARLAVLEERGGSHAAEVELRTSKADGQQLAALSARQLVDEATREMEARHEARSRDLAFKGLGAVFSAIVIALGVVQPFVAAWLTAP